MDREGVLACHEVVQAGESVFNGESPLESLNYVLAVLFWKSASDLWKERRASILSRFAGDVPQVERRMKWERIQIPKGSSFEDQWAFLGASDLGDRINRVLEQIEMANPSLLAGLLGKIDFTCERRLGSLPDRNRRLRQLIEGFNHPAIDFRPSRSGSEKRLGQVVQFLTAQYGGRLRGRRAEFLTPTAVCQVMAKLLAPQKGGSIYDPTCGSGNLLYALAMEAHDADFALFGEEKNGVMLTLCRFSLLLQGVDTFHGFQGDSLRNPQWVVGETLKTFDVVVGHPPFAQSDWGHESAETDPYERFARGVPPRSKGDYAFILHMIQRANEREGRIGVIASAGVLFRKGIEMQIRRRLIEENLLDAVLTLPQKALPGASGGGVILIFKRRRQVRDVVFINASNEFEIIGKQVSVSSRAMDRIVSVYRDRAELDGLSLRVEPEAIAAKGYSLLWEDYTPSVGATERPCREAILEEMAFMESELEHVRLQIEVQVGQLNKILGE